jgi:electron transport complex protein RnfE
MTLPKDFPDGVLSSNPVAVLLLGLCPAAAVTTKVIDALWMSVGVFSVLLLLSLCMSLIGSWTRRETTVEGVSVEVPRIQWWGALAIASCLAACFEVLLLAFAPAASASLGIYVPLIAVNCFVLGSAEIFAGGHPVGRTMLAAAGLGMGFAISLVLIAFFREVLGAGTITLFPVGTFGGTVALPSLSAAPARALLYAGGGLLCIGYLAGLARLFAKGKGDSR